MTRGRRAAAKSLSAVRRRLGRFALAPSDLLRDPVYRRLWISILISSLGGQITMLAVPLTAAVLLDATPTQMGWLTAMETVPFALFALPAGVWLDRVRKLPVYVGGELTMAAVVGQRAPRMVAGQTVDVLAVSGGLRHRFSVYHRRQRGADRADADRRARPVG